MPDSSGPWTPPSEPAEELGPGDEDYVFRFRLEPTKPDEGGYDDPLLELVRGQLADLLDAAVLTYHGRRVMVDGFRLLQDPDTQYEVFPGTEAREGDGPTGE